MGEKNPVAKTADSIAYSGIFGNPFETGHGRLARNCWEPKGCLVFSVTLPPVSKSRETTGVICG
jgi:hypothetical protein